MQMQNLDHATCGTKDEPSDTVESRESRARRAAPTLVRRYSSDILPRYIIQSSEAGGPCGSEYDRHGSEANLRSRLIAMLAFA